MTDDLEFVLGLLNILLPYVAFVTALFFLPSNIDMAIFFMLMAVYLSTRGGAR